MQKKITAEHIFLFSIIFFTVLLYTVRLGGLPQTLHGDEVETAMQALDIVYGKIGLFGVGWFDLPFLSFAQSFFLLSPGVQMYEIDNPKKFTPVAITKGKVGYFLLPEYYTLAREINKINPKMKIFEVKTTQTTRSII